MKRWLYKRPKVIRAASLFESTWQAGIKNVGAYFSVKNTKAEMEAWSPRISVQAHTPAAGEDRRRADALADRAGGFSRNRIGSEAYRGDGIAPPGK